MLPVEAVLADLHRALRDPGAAVLQAPPGAGKTTAVPPALLAAPWLGSQRILMLEPRRLAARAAASRMARLRGEPVGRTVGYRTRLDTLVGPGTRIEVVTEGVLTRMIGSDPTLDGIGLVIFDEFHERSLQADTGLALTLHTRRLVRPELRLLVMSATLDGAAVARLIGGAPIVTAAGREYEVTTQYRAPAARAPRARGPDLAFTAAVVREALREAEGDVLVFLPGAPEIHRLYDDLAEVAQSPAADVYPLHGMLPPEDQDRAIAPSPPGRRKIVLATSIAETSLTIDGVRVVVDTGFTRRPRFSPRTGLSRLETMRVSRAAADQRRGRAGRTAPGRCYRLWSEAEHSALLAFAPPEILEGDLVPLLLDLAAAGVTDPAELAWLDPPPGAAVAQARELLRELDAIDHAGRLTPHGRAMSALATHPRLAHMVLRSAERGAADLACDLAALLGERDPLRRGTAGAGTDVRLRLDALRSPRSYPLADRSAIRRVIDQARAWRSRLPRATRPATAEDAVGALLALAFPDRVAQRRPGPAPRYLLRNGTGAALPDGDPLGDDAYIVVVESDGRSPEAMVRLAAPLALEDLEASLGDQTATEHVVSWDEQHGLRARVERRLGAIVLSDRPDDAPDSARVAAVVAEAIRRRGLQVLPWSHDATRLRQRLAFLHAHDPRWPDVSDGALSATLLAKMGDALARVRSADALRRIDLVGPLLALLDWRQRAELDRVAPEHFAAPTGSRLPIDYSDPAAPAVSVRIQELFGVRGTPALLDGRVPLTLQLLSPAQRPVQVTRDLAGFWRSSYFDVRKDLRARYPKHSWPDDPLSAPPTARATPRRRG